MKPFLYSVAEAFYHTYGSDLTPYTFVFPNRRSGIFFQRYLAQVAGKPIFSPPILTVNDFYASLAPYQSVDRITLLFWLYENYVELTHTEESFDNFLFWGEMILNDFDDIDKYMVDAQQLFTNIKEIKEIEDTFEYLTPDQIAAIRRFWVHFIPAFESPKKMEFITIWEILYPLYQRMRNLLEERNLAYEGMLFREVAQRAQLREGFEVPYQRVVFVGLNVLTRSEQVVMRRLKEMGIADFYWDYDAPTFADNYNKAAYFMKENIIQFPSRLTLQQETPALPQVEVVGISSAVGQAKHAHTILTQLLDSGAIPHPEHAINTAIVLPDEQLLMPLLYSIPQAIDPINVTMGYTLSTTAIAAFMESLFDLQRHFRMVRGVPQFYHRKVLSLLTNRYILLSGAEEVNELADDIRRMNWIFVPTQQLHRNKLLSHLFVVLETPLQAADYLIELLEYLHELIGEEREETPHQTMAAVEVEFLYHYYITVKRLREVIEQQRIPLNVATFFKLLAKMTASISIPFRGEPLSGLQVMGVLETRALDFENLIVLSVNEGVFPVRKVANTFIPYNLRKGFGLSTTDHQDSIYAYYFYRMIYRAKRVYLLYDTRSEGMLSGEMSRYIYQLRYHYRYPMVQRSLSYNIEVEQPTTITIEKSPSILAALSSFLAGGDRAISASALNTYINCPLQFYLQYVEGFTPDDEVSENIESSTFGSIYHSVMEYIYAPYIGKEVTAPLLDELLKNHALLQGYIEQAFAQHYFKQQKPQPLTGQNYLVGEVIKQYIVQTLKVDKRRAPFLYVASELRLEHELPISPTQQVRIKAFLDRVDRHGDQLTIIDYKTGSGKSKFKSIEQLFDPAAPNRPKAIMQLLFYAMIYSLGDDTLRIEPRVYYMRDVFSDSLNTAVLHEVERNNAIPLSNFAQYDAEFREQLVTLLQQIFDEQTPFEQTPDVKHCTYCNFTHICKRQ